MRTIGNDQSKTRETQVVASGALEIGKTVVINSDGTASVITESSASETLGTGATFVSAGDNPKEMSIVYDSNSDRVVIAYKAAGASNYGYAVVGTVSGTTISYGTAVQFAAGWTEEPSLAFDSTNNKVVIAFRDRSNSFYGTAIVGTVSGTSISFGTEVVYYSGNISANPKGTSYDTANQKVVIAFRDNSQSNRGKAVVGTISGTSISFGSPTIFQSQRTRSIAISYNSTEQKHLICFCNQDQQERIQAVVGTVSGTSISFGSVSDGNSSPTTYIDADYSSTHNKHVVVYHDQNAGGDGIVSVVTISGTTASWGGSATFETGSTVYNSVAYSDVSNSFVTFCIDDTNNAYPTRNTGTISGTTPSVGTPQTTGNTAQSLYTDVVATKDGQFVICNQNGSTSYGASRVFQAGYTATNLTSDNYIGFGKGVVDAASQSVGSESVFESASVIDLSATYDANAQKVVVTYTDGGNNRYGTAVVGTVSGTSITFGTPVVWVSRNIENATPVYDSNAQKIVIGYQDRVNADYGTGIVGTVSGTSISFGSSQVFDNVACTEISGAFDSTNNKVVFAFRTSSSNGKAVVGTVSGTSVSFGSFYTFESGDTYSTSTVYDTNAQKIVISYIDSQDSFRGKSVVATVSGTALSYGAITTFYSASTGFVSSVYDPDSQKVIVCYVDNSSGSLGTAKVGTVSGTSITFGGENVFNNASTQYTSVTYDEGQNKLVVAYRDVGNSNSGTVIPGTVSGTSITFGDETVFNGSESNFNTAVYDAASGNSVISYIDNGNSNYGTSVVFQNAYNNSQIVPDGGAVVINTQGSVAETSTALTAGQSYYVQTDGTLSTTADDPSVFAGTAVSSTKLIVKG